MSAAAVPENLSASDSSGCFRPASGGWVPQGYREEQRKTLGKSDPIMDFKPVGVRHSPATQARVKVPVMPGFDVLEAVLARNERFSPRSQWLRRNHLPEGARYGSWDRQVSARNAVSPAA